jgi:hypothetical protein
MLFEKKKHAEKGCKMNWPLLKRGLLSGGGAEYALCLHCMQTANCLNIYKKKDLSYWESTKCMHDIGLPV